MSIHYRDIIFHLIREYRSLNSSEIEYREGTPSALEFARIVRTNRPLVFREAIQDWPALKKWQSSVYLRDAMADTLVTVAETPDGNADSIVNGHFVEPHQTKIPFSKMLDWLRSRQTGNRSGPIRYVQSQNSNLTGEFEILHKDICELTWANECFEAHPDAKNIWIGNEESKTSLHLDHYENLYCQIVGSKTFYLVPPSEYSCLRERRFRSARWGPSEDKNVLRLCPLNSETPWLMVDPSAPNESDDKIANICKPILVTLQQGEVLYLPALWFHAVTQQSNSEGLCVAVNYWYDMDFTGPLYPMFNFLKNVTKLEEGRTEEIQLEQD